MNVDAYMNLGLAAAGTFSSWAIWVSVSVFKHNQEIELLKQEIRVLNELKVILEDIRFEDKK